MRNRITLLAQARTTREIFARALTVDLPDDVLEQLRIGADLRGVHPAALVRRLVETVIDDGLLDSVLDDADEIEARADRREAHRQRAGGFARVSP